MFTFHYDERSGILRIRVVGAWSLDEIHRYGREAGPQFATARRKAGALRLLIDLIDADLLRKEFVEPLARAGMRHGRADDRVAMVLCSSLMKLQMKRMIGNAPSEMFLSDGAAQTWLMAYDEAKQADVG